MENKEQQKLKIYHEIWSRLHSKEFLNLDFKVELEEFEKIIRTQLNFCSCGADSQYIITYLIKMYTFDFFDSF